MGFWTVLCVCIGSTWVGVRTSVLVHVQICLSAYVNLCTYMCACVCACLCVCVHVIVVLRGVMVYGICTFDCVYVIPMAKPTELHYILGYSQAIYYDNP